MRHYKNIHKHEEGLTKEYRKMLHEESIARADRWTGYRHAFELNHPKLSAYVEALILSIPLIGFYVYIIIRR